MILPYKIMPRHTINQPPRIQTAIYTSVEGTHNGAKEK